MIKLLDILKEITGDVDTIWYHGSTADITQNDLDPLHRDSDAYKKDTNRQLWAKTGSSGGGVGIYFGSSKTDLCSSCPMQYTGFHSTDPNITQGFMYEMKLKSDANIIKYSGIENITKDKFDEFRKQGVDGLVSIGGRSSELNLLNPQTIQYFKKIMYWKKPEWEWVNV